MARKRTLEVLRSSGQGKVALRVGRFAQDIRTRSDIDERLLSGAYPGKRRRRVVLLRCRDAAQGGENGTQSDGGRLGAAIHAEIAGTRAKVGRSLKAEIEVGSAPCPL
jgi:hypothetical protein